MKKKITPPSVPTSRDTVRRLFESELFRRRELTEPHASYAREKIQFQIIREGRVDELEKQSSLYPDGTAGTLSNDRLRNEKNMLISGITLFTRAAMDGGVDESLAYAMSDGFIRYGEQCKTIQELQDLSQRAFTEFTYAVAFHEQKKYSGTIYQSINYIRLHLHEKITLQGISEAIGISPCHLSRIFPKETGLSVVDFIQKERVIASKHYLTYTQDPIAVISEFYHFSSQSYYSKIFFKFTGMTPAVYRKTYAGKGE